MNVDPARRDAAGLVALAEAVADVADANHQHDLARFARCAAHRFQAGVLAADPHALAVSRYEVDRLLRVGFTPTPEPSDAYLAAPTPGP